MPELPDVEIFRRLADKATGNKILEADVESTDILDDTRKDFNEYVRTLHLTDTGRKGKYLSLEAKGPHFLIMHFGMTGTLHYLNDPEENPGYTKCTLHLDNDHKLCYVSKRKLGSIAFTDDLEDFFEKKKVGQDALEVDKKAFVERMQANRSMIKSALMDQSVFSGIGNIYSDEILFQSGIHPKTKARTLSAKELETVFNTMQRILKVAIRHRAKPAEMPDAYLIGNRESGAQCPKCKEGNIRKMSVSGRTAYYCPSCQRKK